MQRCARMTFSLAIVILVGTAVPGHTQDFPTKPIRVLVGAAPGGLIDLFARTFAANCRSAAASLRSSRTTRSPPARSAPIWSRRPPRTATR